MNRDWAITMSPTQDGPTIRKFSVESIERDRISADYVRRRDSQNLVNTGYTRSHPLRTTQS